MNVLTKFEKSEQIQSLIKEVVLHLTKNPPTLGHGFSHFIKTSRNAFKSAVSNNPKLTDKVYIAGLLHDIYRPAQGEAGLETHEDKSSKIAYKIISDCYNSQLAQEISSAINFKDKQIISRDVSEISIILSIADKIDMSFQRGVAYAWASNKNKKNLKEKPVYHNYIEVMRDFAQYQVKTWDVFNSVKVKGLNDAIASYTKTNQQLLRAVQQEAMGKISYPKHSKIISQKEAQLDLHYLNKFNVSKRHIKKITQSYAGLIN